MKDLEGSEAEVRVDDFDTVLEDLLGILGLFVRAKQIVNVDIPRAHTE
jgi:hypothetical protein